MKATTVNGRETRTVGARNCPVAHYPELEEAILPSSAEVLKAIRETARY